MRANEQGISRTATPSEIRERGENLRYRLRIAGYWSYWEWLQDHNPKAFNSDEVRERIYRIFNGRGSKKDLPLIKECEVLADTFLPKHAARP